MVSNRGGIPQPRTGILDVQYMLYTDKETTWNMDRHRITLTVIAVVALTLLLHIAVAALNQNLKKQMMDLHTVVYL